MGKVTLAQPPLNGEWATSSWSLTIFNAYFSLEKHFACDISWGTVMCCNCIFAPCQVVVFYRCCHIQKLLTCPWLCESQPGRVREPTPDRRWWPQRSTGIQCSGRSWKNEFSRRNFPQLESLSCTLISLDPPPPPYNPPTHPSLYDLFFCLFVEAMSLSLSLSLSLSSPTPARCPSSGTHSLSPLKLDLLFSFIRFQKGQEKEGLCPINARTAAFTNRS